MSNRDFSDFDDQRIQEFEANWLAGNPQPISECLPQTTDPRFLGTLEELVHIDLEFRWKQFEKSDRTQATPPTIETYLQQYPTLYAVKLGLIQGEFDLANRFGGAVSVDEFVSRFGDRIDGSQLRPILQSQLSEINRTRRLQPGQTLGRYEIVNEHGRGGFGAVWRATDTKLGRRIAVKQLGQKLAADSESRRRFISEARVTARLEHPGIVPVYDISNVQDDHAYYTMRLIQGKTLAEAIDDLHQLVPNSNEFRLRRQQLLQSFVDVCLTIGYAHAQGVIHRDLKPQNIIVGAYGETILLDWGLASVIDDPAESESIDSIGADPQVLTQEESLQTLQGSVLGTPAYMPPEQASGQVEQISRQSDVYSLGATLYHLATGSIPFTDQDLEGLLDRVKTGDLPAANELNPQLEKPLSGIISRAMQPKPQQRYPSVAELVDDVQRFLADQPVSAHQDSPVAVAARWIRKNPTKAAALALTTLFLAIAGIAGILINNAWQASEDARITRLQIAAERADATALSQIKAGRFDAAVRTLGQANELVQSEPYLMNLATQIRDRETRTRQIVEFYRLGQKAQEETFFDRTHRSAIYCQAALDELGVLDEPGWWNQLPDRDLGPMQQEQLQSEVYRITTLLASMRLAETAESAVSLNILLDPKSLPVDDSSATSLQAARFAAQVANQYRPSRAMRMIEEIGGVASGSRQAIDLTNLNPYNAVDSAIMGSILDNNVPPDGLIRNAISGLLEMRDPNRVAEQWLDDALKYNPDWFWLPVFTGHSQVRTGTPEEGIRTISHAVGIRPDYWVGYQYRALASVAAATEERSRKRKSTLLNAASRDIQRAMDLEPYNSELFWTKAVIQFHSGDNPAQITDTFLTAFELHPSLREIRGGHYSAISKMFYSRAQAFVDWQKQQGQSTSELACLEIAIQLWQGELDQAKTLCLSARQTDPSNQQLIALEQLIQNRLDNSTGKTIEVSENDYFAWQLHCSNAVICRSHNQFENEVTSLRKALEHARTQWQRSKTQSELARGLIQLGQTSDAEEWVRKTIALDQAVDLSRVEQTARHFQADSIVQLCVSHAESNQPRLDFTKTNKPGITRPALLNAGFELGLSYHWSAFTRRTTTASWNNVQQSRTSAEAVPSNAKHGNRCLALQLDCPLTDDSFGQMTQSIPVTANQQYELTFWAKSDTPDSGSVDVGFLDPQLKDWESSTALDAGKHDWKLYRVRFQPDQEEVNIGVRARGNGRVWLDDFQVSAVE